jgi:hypothetical protein
VARQRNEVKDKRKTRRIEPYLAPCRIVLGRRRLSGYVTNLSERGARVYCDEPPPLVGQAVALEIRFRARAAFSRLRAQARWVRMASDVTGLHSFGASFRRLSAEEKRTVAAVLHEFRRRAALLLEAAG